MKICRGMGNFRIGRTALGGKMVKIRVMNEMDESPAGSGERVFQSLLKDRFGGWRRQYQLR
jgi:hypothetical protein